MSPILPPPHPCQQQLVLANIHVSVDQLIGLKNLHMGAFIQALFENEQEMCENAQDLVLQLSDFQLIECPETRLEHSVFPITTMVTTISNIAIHYKVPTQPDLQKANCFTSSPIFYQLTKTGETMCILRD